MHEGEWETESDGSDGRKKNNRNIRIVTQLSV